MLQIDWCGQSPKFFKEKTSYNADNGGWGQISKGFELHKKVQKLTCITGELQKDLRLGVDMVRATGFNVYF